MVRARQRVMESKRLYREAQMDFRIRILQPAARLTPSTLVLLTINDSDPIRLKVKIMCM